MPRLHNRKQWLSFIESQNRKIENQYLRSKEFPNTMTIYLSLEVTH